MKTITETRPVLPCPCCGAKTEAKIEAKYYDDLQLMNMDGMAFSMRCVIKCPECWLNLDIWAKGTGESEAYAAAAVERYAQETIDRWNRRAGG